MRLNLEQIKDLFRRSGVEFKPYVPPVPEEHFERFITFKAGEYDYCITWYANMSTLNLGNEPCINSSFKFVDIEEDDWWFKKGLRFIGVSGDNYLVALEPMRSIKDEGENENDK